MNLRSRVSGELSHIFLPALLVSLTAETGQPFSVFYQWYLPNFSTVMAVLCRQYGTKQSELKTKQVDTDNFFRLPKEIWRAHRLVTFLGSSSSVLLSTASNLLCVLALNTFMPFPPRRPFCGIFQPTIHQWSSTQNLSSWRHPVCIFQY